MLFTELPLLNLERGIKTRRVLLREFRKFYALMLKEAALDMSKNI